MKSSIINVKKGKGLFHKLVLLASLLVFALVLQACGESGNNAVSTTASSTNTSKSVVADEGTDIQASSTNVLNFGFVGSLPLVAGAEGWGIHTGIFQEELSKYGITEINAIGFKVGPDLNEAVIAGSVDLGLSGDTPAILNRAKGAKTRLLSQPDVESNSLIVVRHDGPNTVAELEGKVISVVKGSIMHRYLVGTLELAGVKDAKQISIGSNTADSLAALIKGDVDAVAATDALVYKHVKDGSVKVIDTAFDHPELLATMSIIVTEDFVKKFPGIAEAWDTARQIALADLQSKPDEYYAHLSQLFGIDDEAVRTLYPIDGISPTKFTDEGIERVKGSKDFLVEQDLAASDFDIDEWILK